MIAEFDTHLLSIDRDSFMQLMSESTDFRRLIATTFSHRMRDVLSGKKARRFARHVIFVVPPHQDIDIPFDVARRLAGRGERLALVARTALAENNVHSIQLDVDQLGEIWNRTQSKDFDRVVFVVDAEFATQRVELIEKADEVLWCFFPDRHKQIYDLATQVIVESPIDTSKLKRVCLLNDDQRVAPPNIVDDRLHKRDFIMPAKCTDKSSQMYGQGIDRLTRHLCDVKIGLSLAGGGARGLVHFGVLAALEREQVSFDMMSGTSAGAMFGISYATALGIDFLVDAYTKDLTPGFPFTWMPDPNRSFLIWKYRSRGWDAMLRPYFDAHLEQLQIPFSAVSVDLVGGKVVVTDRGDVIPAMLESLNLPGIAAPIMRDGMALVDGGVLNNLPADVLVDKGADFVVGVNVSADMAKEFGRNVPGMKTQEMKRVGNVETLFRVLEVMGAGTSKAQRNNVDVLVVPDTSQHSFTDFTKGKELAEIGESAVEGCLSDIKNKIAELMKFR